MTGRGLASAAVALGVIVLSLVGIGRLSPQPPKQAAPARAALAPDLHPPQTDKAVAQSTGRQPVLLEAPPPAAPVVLTRPSLVPIPLTTGATSAVVQIEAIASRTDMPDRLKARTLIQMLPGLPAEALARAADEAASRLPDSDYAAVLLPTLVDPGTHGTVISVLFTDLMERPDTITLPALLAIARNTQHPFAPSARDNLSLLLGRNFEEDWANWEVEIRRRLSPPKH